VLGLDNAGAGDQKKPTRAHLHGPNFEGRTHDTNSIVLRGSVPFWAPVSAKGLPP